MSEQIGRTASPGSGPRPTRDPKPTPPGEQPGEDPRAASLWTDAWRQLRRDPSFLIPATIIVVFATMAAFPGLFTSTDPISQNLSRSLEGPQSGAPFGYDLLGRDYYARTVYGARVSMTIGLIVVGGASIIAVIFGSIAGFFGRWADAILSRITDLFFSIPLLLAAIAFLAAVPNRGLFEVSAVLMVFGWPTMMRITRSTILAEKEQEYVEAARALGANSRRIIVRHLLPNTLAPVVVYATIAVGVIIAAEATLSFLGVGIDLPAISWGRMVAEAESRVLIRPHLLLFPGSFLSLTVFGFILMGDALRDALDPRLR